MNPEYEEQAQRLQELRRSIALDSPGASLSGSGFGQGVARSGTTDVQDPLIYPGVYAPTGFDMMGILIRVRTRPNPTFNLGNVDSGVSLVLCDTGSSDLPIVYCSEPFEVLTGYSSAEILGRNCRFLQHPERGYCQDPNTNKVNEIARQELRGKIERGEEACVRFINFTKEGKVFFNLLTVVPILWEEGSNSGTMGKRYYVGFQAAENSSPF